jgi:transposase
MKQHHGKQQTRGTVGDRTIVAKGGLPAMQPNVAGIDIGSREMYVCGPTPEGSNREMKIFATTTEGIQSCAQWLHQRHVRSVAMESTGVYWIPVLEILEGSGVETLLVDTRPLSRVPGKKTDVEDCQWIQTLHSHGLLQSSYRPSEAISQVRSLVRQKAVLVREQADWVRRMHKCLDQMNVRVHHAVSDTQGTTGMAIIRSIVSGERDARKLAALRDPHCRKSEEEIAAHLTGNWSENHLFNLKHCLRMYDFIAEQIAEYEKEIQRRMELLTPPGRQQLQAPPLANPEKRKAMKRRGQEEKRQTLFRTVGADLTTIDGIGVETAEAIISEYGTDLSKFPNERTFVKHVQLAPHKAVSGGKPLKKSRRKTKGTRTAEALRHAATAVRDSNSALGAYYRRISRRLGGSIAVFATARKLATFVYRMLRWGQAYVDIGQKADEERYQAAKLRALSSTAAQFGYQVVKIEALSR